MNLLEYIRKAKVEAHKQNIRTNSIMLNRNVLLVREAYFRSYYNADVQIFPPMVCGLSAYLTDDLPDGIAFAMFESPNLPPTREEEIKQEARREFLDELREISLSEISKLIGSEDEDESSIT